MFWCNLTFSFTLQSKELSFKEIVVLMLKQSKKNYWIANSLPEHVIEVDFKDVDLLKTLKTLLQTENYYLKDDEVGFTVLSADKRRLESKVFYLKHAHPENITKIITEANLLSHYGKITFEAQHSLLVVRDYRENLLEIEQNLKQLDQPVKQILIEAKIISIDKNYTQQFGLALKVEKGLNITPDALVVNLAKIAPQWLNYQLNALEKSGHGKVISQPSLFTKNRQAASIETGAEVPYLERNRHGDASTVFKKAVLSLLVTPEVTSKGEINLSLQINQDKVANGIKEVQAPIINTRKVKTQIKLRNEETAVIGGIYEWQNEEFKNSLPFVGRIPVLNWLVSDKSKNIEQREMLILVTAKIL